MRRASVLLAMLSMSVGLLGIPLRAHAAPGTTPRPSASVKAGAHGAAQRATIVIDHGYRPASVTVKAGRPVELTFVRKETSGCGDVVQIPSLGLKRSLKTGEKTVFRFTPKAAGTIEFTCGMKMYQGRIVSK